MSRFKKFLALSVTEKKIFLAALCSLPMVFLKLRLFGFKGTLSRLQQIPVAVHFSDIEPAAHPAQISYLVNGAARLLFRREACLERSIMLWSVLRRKGIESELKIGVATEDSTMRAHAWVEIDGEPINEQPLISQNFSAFNSSLTADYNDYS